MNPSGLWRGMTEADGRVGHFKFINVEMIPQQRSNERKRSDRRKRSNASSKVGTSTSKDQSDQQAPNETNADSRTEPQLGVESADRKYSSTNTNVMDNNGYLTSSRSDSHALPTSTHDESNSNSRPKSVEDLLRRIGLEVWFV